MTFAALRTRFAQFLRSADATDPVISTTDRDTVLNEAFHFYWALYGSSFFYTADRSGSGNTIAFGVAGDNQWIELEQFERKVGTEYMPLKRQTIGQVLALARGEGATGAPEIYGPSLRSRTLSTTTSQFVIAVYPIPDQSYTYRARIRTWQSDLVNAGEVISSLSDPQADYIARLAAFGAGALLGYGDAWAASVLAPLPDAVRREFALDDYNRWPISTPRRIGETP